MASPQTSLELVGTHNVPKHTTLTNPTILAPPFPTPPSPLQPHHALHIPPPPPIPKSSNPALPFSVPPQPPFPAPQSAQQPHPPLPLRPLTFAVIQYYYRLFRRFFFMELLKSFIGFGVGAFMTYLLLKNKK